jgi:hypothetical protein
MCVSLEKLYQDTYLSVSKNVGAVEKVLVKGFKFSKLAIYLTYLTYNVGSLSFLNTFSTPRVI